MSKIPIELHAPIDYIILRIGEQFFPLFDKYKITPNQITYISIILSIGCIYYLFIQPCPIKAIILYGLQYVLDCWDGHYARYSNQVTDLGDKLDHYKDMVINGAVYYYLFKNWNIDNMYFYILLFFTFITLVHYSCIDNYYFHINNPEGFEIDKVVLGYLQNICYIPKKYKNDKPKLKKYILRMLDMSSLLGNGTVILYLCYLMYLVSPKINC